jgi:hypothetical protein
MRLTILLALLTCLQPFVAAAQESSPFPSVPINAETLRTQAEADELYDRANYERAFSIYHDELAPLGDKYGQYMVGFMYLAGNGVPEDRVAASAWYRLAAERGTRESVRARDRLVKALDAEQKSESDRMFIELRKEYGDLALMMEAACIDQKLLQERTGSRLSASSSPLLIVRPGHIASTQTGEQYYGQIEQRLHARLEFIAAATNIDIIDINKMDFSTLESKVDQHLEELD